MNFYTYVSMWSDRKRCVRAQSRLLGLRFAYLCGVKFFLFISFALSLLFFLDIFKVNCAISTQSFTAGVWSACVCIEWLLYVRMIYNKKKIQKKYLDNDSWYTRWASANKKFPFHIPKLWKKPSTLFPFVFIRLEIKLFHILTVFSWLFVCFLLRTIESYNNLCT